MTFIHSVKTTSSRCCLRKNNAALYVQWTYVPALQLTLAHSHTHSVDTAPNEVMLMLIGILHSNHSALSLLASASLLLQIDQ